MCAKVATDIGKARELAGGIEGMSLQVRAAQRGQIDNAAAAGPVAAGVRINRGKEQHQGTKRPGGMEEIFSHETFLLTTDFLVSAFHCLARVSKQDTGQLLDAWAIDWDKAFSVVSGGAKAGNTGNFAKLSSRTGHDPDRGH